MDAFYFSADPIQSKYEASDVFTLSFDYSIALL